jgi:hypothetical protein
MNNALLALIGFGIGLISGSGVLLWFFRCEIREANDLCRKVADNEAAMLDLAHEALQVALRVKELEKAR